VGSPARLDRDHTGSGSDRWATIHEVKFTDSFAGAGAVWDPLETGTCDAAWRCFPGGGDPESEKTMRVLPNFTVAPLSNCVCFGVGGFRRPGAVGVPRIRDGAHYVN
jgi:hypothetical protein